jgi:transcriptional regulator with XRE-family HTH domain
MANDPMWDPARGQIVRSRREEMRYTRDAVIAALPREYPLSVSGLKNIEAGKVTRPRSDTLRALAKVLRLDPAALGLFEPGSHRGDDPSAIVRSARATARDRLRAYQTRLNELFEGHAVLLAAPEMSPELEHLGELSVTEDVASRASRFRASLLAQHRPNDGHAVLAEDPRWHISPVALRYWSTDYASVRATRECAAELPYEQRRGARPRVLSASGVFVHAEGGQLLLHQRGIESATYPGAWHTLGGAYIPGIYSDHHGRDVDLGFTLTREVLEETKLSVDVDAQPLTWVFASEPETAFVQYVALGVALRTVRTQDHRFEGKARPVAFEALPRQLLENEDWVPTGKLHVLAWLAAGAPGAAGSTFAEYDSSSLLEKALAQGVPFRRTAT